MSVIAHCTPKMVTEGERALQLWADESLREEIDARRMAELVWQAMAPHSNYRGAVEVTDEKVQRAAKALAGRYGEEVGWADWQGVARTALEAAGGQ